MATNKVGGPKLGCYGVAARACQARYWAEFDRKVEALRNIELDPLEYDEIRGQLTDWIEDRLRSLYDSSVYRKHLSERDAELEKRRSN